MLDEDDEYEDSEEGDEGEAEDEDSSTVFVGMAFGREGCDDAFEVIDDVCNDVGLTAVRAHPDEIVGSPAGDEVVVELLGDAECAILDLTHQRESVAHEIGLADAAFDRADILLIAKTGTPRFANIQGRTIHYYDNLTHLRMIVQRQLAAMIEAWDEIDEEADEDADGDEE